jgi:hypothetical protein
VNVGTFAARAHGIKSSHTPSKRMLSAWHKFSAAREGAPTIAIIGPVRAASAFTSTRE